MAFTVSTIVEGVVFGNQVTRTIRVTADAAEANLTLGFQNINFVSIQPEKGISMPCAHLNKNSTGTVANGTLGISATSSGNIFHAIVMGN